MGCFYFCPLGGIVLLVCVLLWGSPTPAAVFLSEVQGNPKAQLDSDGEYLELAYNLSSENTPESFEIIIDGDTLSLSLSGLNGFGTLLLCKDSSYMASLNMPCYANWSVLNIPNSKEVPISLYQEGELKIYHPPLALEGKSWENNFSEGWESENWVESSLAMESGDKGTPGRFHPEANLPWENDVYIQNTEPDSAESEIEIQLGVKNSVSGISLGWQLTEDLDFDGMADVILKSEDITIIPNTKSHRFSVNIPPDSAFHLYQIKITGDSYEANNSELIVKEGVSRLAITEVCPNPPEGLPEWFEIYNMGKTDIHLNQITYSGNVLEIRPGNMLLKANQYALITQDRELLESHYPHLSNFIWEVSPWDILKNSGSDTLQLKTHGGLLAQMHYHYKDLKEENGCLVPANENLNIWVQKPLSQNSGELYAASPGYQQKLTETFKYSINQKVISKSDINSNAQLTIEAPLTESYHISLFDFNGYSLIDFGEFRGSEIIAIDLRLQNGNVLQPNPYIVLIEREGNRSYKIPLVVKL